VSNPITTPETEASSRPQTGESTGPFTWFARLQGQTKNWLLKELGVDRAVAFTVFARGWSGFAGVITILLIAHFLSPAEQGYYYVFGNLIAVQIIFELGFSFVILQMASHERAHLTISADDVISGDPIAHARLASVLQKTVRWYTTAALVLVVSLLVAGSYFFSIHHQGATIVHWQIPWYACALAATLTFQLDPILSFMEGCGFVPNVARLRFAQALTGSTFAWLALATHHGLFAPATLITCNVVVAILWIFRRRRLLLPLMRLNPGAHRIDWMKEVWPFQWRIAVSWLSGYFIFQIYNPILFAYRGAVAAGQMGMSLSIANGLQGLAVSWLSTKIAPFGSLIARKEFQQLDRVFFRALRQAVVVCIAITLIAWLGCLYLNVRNFKFAHRFLEPSLLAIVFLSSIMNIFVFGEAFYLRAHKQEKFLINSVIGAFTIGLSAFFLGRLYGAAGMVISTALLNVVGLIWATSIFLKYRRMWHAG
jgi:O-antigen/teichoic acid export membrane protein